jgi:hypothetical protein
MLQRFVAAGFLAAVGLGLAGLAAPSTVDAQTQEPRAVLGEHRFIWNSFTRTPFPRTYVRNLTGGGKFTNVEYIPSFTIGETEIEAVKGDLLFAELEFEYMHQIQPWLGMWAHIGGLARLGTDAGALLAQGVTAIFGYELGWLFRMYESESFILSGTASLSNDGVTDVNLLRWVEGIIDDEDHPLVLSNPRLRGTGGLRAAWGLNETWGLQFLGNAGYGESTVRGEGNRWFFDYAGSASIDLYPETNFPLGFVVSAATRSSPREGGNPDLRTTDVGLRTAFTGRNNYLIALDTSWNGFELADGDRVGLLRAGLSLQLFF